MISQAGDFRKLLSQLAARPVAKRWSSKAQLVHLLLDRLQNFRVLVPDVQIDQLRAEIEPLLAIAIPEPDALASCDVHGV